MEAGPKIVRKFVKLGAAVDFNGALGGVADDITVVTPLEMFFKFGPCLRVHGVVKVVGQLF
jgi:hypothetical protein